MRLRDTARRLQDRGMLVAMVAAFAFAVVPLYSLLEGVTARGLPRVFHDGTLDLAFLTGLPDAPMSKDGGVGSALVGTVAVVLLAALFSVPIGVGAGTFMSENPASPLARLTRFTAEVIGGLPSIVAGVVAYGLAVKPFGHFSAYAGAAALTLLFVPMVAIVTQEAMAMVPTSQREGALALGLSEATTTLGVVIPAALGSILTGIMLAVARVAGETAPLLFTAFDNKFWPAGPSEPTATLSVQIYGYALSPFKAWQEQAWGGAFLLIGGVLLMNIVVRITWARRERFMRGMSGGS